MAVKSDVVDAVKALVGAHPNLPLYVTGHSLGAALAALAASELAHGQSLPVTAVYTFGQPRVGNQAFQAFYNTGPHVAWRVTHWKDPVPHLPMKALGFHHVSTEVWYDHEDSSSYRVCDGSGEDGSCSNSVASTSLLHIADHHTYINIDIDGAGPDTC